MGGRRALPARTLRRCGSRSAAGTDARRRAGLRGRERPRERARRPLSGAASRRGCGGGAAAAPWLARCVRGLAARLVSLWAPGGRQPGARLQHGAAREGRAAFGPGRLGLLTAAGRRAPPRGHVLASRGRGPAELQKRFLAVVRVQSRVLDARLGKHVCPPRTCWAVVQATRGGARVLSALEAAGPSVTAGPRARSVLHDFTRRTT